MSKLFVNPFTAILTGATIGLAIVMPFGGLAVFQPSATGRFVTCNIMGCKVQSLRP